MSRFSAEAFLSSRSGRRRQSYGSPASNALDQNTTDSDLSMLNLMNSTSPSTETVYAFRVTVPKRDRLAAENDVRWADFARDEHRGEVSIDFDGEREVKRFLARLRPIILNSDRNYIVKTAGNYVTLHKDNLNKTVDQLVTRMDGGIPNVRESRTWEEMTEKLVGRGTLTIMEYDYMRRQEGIQFNEVSRIRPAGAFFPYTHKYQCEHLTNILARLGCFQSVTPRSDNCIIEACIHAGMTDAHVDHLRQCVKRRKVSLVELKKFAEEVDICISVYCINKNVGAGGKNGLGTSKIFNGPVSSAKQVIRLALYEEHYFINETVEVHKWALKNYEKIKGRSKWWEYKTDKKRDRKEGYMRSFELLYLIEKQPITGEDSAIFTTYYHDRVNLLDCSTLEYPDSAVRPFRKKKRTCDADEIVFFDIETCTERSADLKTAVDLMKIKVIRSCDTIEKGQKKLDDLIWHLDQSDLVEIKKRLAPYCPHDAYLICSVDSHGNEAVFSKGNICRRFLNHLAKSYGEAFEVESQEHPSQLDEADKEDERKKKIPSVILCAHNASYDWSVILPYLFNLNLVNKGTRMVCGSGLFFTYPKDGKSFRVRLVFKDSSAIIPMTLKSFGKSFNLKIEKEVMPYRWYTDENILSRFADADELKEYIDEDDYDTLIANLLKLGCKTEGNMFDMIKYSIWYCLQDCRVLKDGYNTFRDSIQSFFNIDINAYPTLSSVSDQVMTDRGVYGDQPKDGEDEVLDNDRVFEVSGVPLQFIKRCSVGGRTMCRDNQRSISANMADFDAVSLYPSAMVRLANEIGGVLKGKPKVWNDGIDLAKVDGYFIDIEVTGVGRKLPFPTVCLKEDGCNKWTNDLVGQKLSVDKIKLENMVKRQGIEYKILRGYYYDEGRDPRIGDAIQYMFEKRKHYKDPNIYPEGNPLQLILKLILNCAYGICGLKEIETDVKYVSTKNFDIYCKRNYDRIKCFTQLGKGEWRFEVYKEINAHYNRIHIAAEILSMSKLIMDEVMVLAEDLKINITYTDTDSIHITATEVPRLAEEFKNLYGRELIGSELGQFHTDFSFDGTFCVEGDKLVSTTMKAKGEIIATNSVIVAKKTYVDELEDSEGNKCYHIRMKGIPIKVFQSICNRAYNGDPIALFMDLYNGKAVIFNFNLDGNFVWKRRKDHITYSCDMKRCVQFVIDEGSIGEQGGC